MTQPIKPIARKRPFQLSLDAWAVIVALAAALLIRVGIIPRVPW